VPITFAQAALGTAVRVPLVGGGEEELDIDPGTQSGTVLRLRGKGLPALDRNGRGDLHVTIRVETPRRISAEQRELLEKLAELDGKETAERGIFERVKDIFN
jgi:molecular chaperone DnaJ